MRYVRKPIMTLYLSTKRRESRLTNHFFLFVSELGSTLLPVRQPVLHKRSEAPRLRCQLDNQVYMNVGDPTHSAPSANDTLN